MKQETGARAVSLGKSRRLHKAGLFETVWRSTAGEAGAVLAACLGETGASVASAVPRSTRKVPDLPSSQYSGSPEHRHLQSNCTPTPHN